MANIYITKTDPRFLLEKARISFVGYSLASSAEKEGQFVSQGCRNCFLFALAVQWHNGTSNGVKMKTGRLIVPR
jgi:hypothetical protein